MASSAVEDLKKVRLALVELRRREAAQIVNKGGELPTYAAGIFNTMNWIGAVDRAIEDEEKMAIGRDGVAAIAATDKPRGRRTRPT
jgi:hypothetical protein